MPTTISRRRALVARSPIVVVPLERNPTRVAVRAVTASSFVLRGITYSVCLGCNHRCPLTLHCGLPGRLTFGAGASGLQTTLHSHDVLRAEPADGYSVSMQLLCTGSWHSRMALAPDSKRLRIGCCSSLKGIVLRAYRSPSPVHRFVPTSDTWLLTCVIPM